MTKSRDDGEDPKQQVHDPGRRKFLKGVGIAGAGAAIADHLHYQQGVSSPDATRHDWYMALAYTVRDRMMERYDTDAVTVRATKPEPPIPLPVEEVTVEVWKERGD